MTDNIARSIKAARAEAIENFKSELKKRCTEGGIYPAYVECMADVIAEEMTGNKKVECGNLKNKCGSCAYAMPTTFGNGTAYVECTNQEHIDKYCKRPISRIRQRTCPACRSYKEMTEEEK